MSDDLLSRLGREQRDDLQGEASSDQDAFGRPFDADERAAILDAVFERVDEAAPTAEAPAPSNVVPFRSRRAVLAGSLAAAAAAAAVIWWVRPDGDGEQLTMLPAYTFSELEGGVAQVRSDPSKATDAAVPELQLRPSSTIKWVLTPAESVQGSIGVALLARSDSGATQFVPRLTVLASEHGGLQLRGRLDEHVALAPGSWTVTLFIAPPDQLPSSSGAAEDDSERWRSLSLRVIIVPEE